MSRVLRCLLLSASVLLSAGCLYTDEPLGEPATLEPSEWEGLWVCNIGEAKSRTTAVRLKSGVTGINGIAATENWRECDARRVESRAKVSSCHYGDWYFDCCERRLVTGAPCRTSRAFLRQRDSILGFVPDMARIRKLLDEGKVPGRVEFQLGTNVFTSEPAQETLVVLHSLTDEHYEILFDRENGAFKPDDVVCIRLPAELDPCNRGPDR